MNVLIQRGTGGGGSPSLLARLRAWVLRILVCHAEFEVKIRVQCYDEDGGGRGYAVVDHTIKIGDWRDVSIDIPVRPHERIQVDYAAVSVRWRIDIPPVVDDGDSAGA